MKLPQIQQGAQPAATNKSQVGYKTSSKFNKEVSSRVQEQSTVRDNFDNGSVVSKTEQDILDEMVGAKKNKTEANKNESMVSAKSGASRNASQLSNQTTTSNIQEPKTYTERAQWKKEIIIKQKYMKDRKLDNLSEIKEEDGQINVADSQELRKILFHQD